MTFFQRVDRLPKFIKFSLVGGTNSVVEAIVFEALILFGSSVILAHVISYTCACVNSYTWNRRFTFRSAAEKYWSHQMVKFAIVCLITLSLSTAVIYVIVHGTHLDTSTMIGDWIAKVPGMAVANITDFFGARLWAFRKPKQPAEREIAEE